MFLPLHRRCGRKLITTVGRNTGVVTPNGIQPRAGGNTDIEAAVLVSVEETSDFILFLARLRLSEDQSAIGTTRDIRLIKQVWISGAYKSAISWRPFRTFR